MQILLFEEPDGNFNFPRKYIACWTAFGENKLQPALGLPSTISGYCSLHLPKLVLAHDNLIRVGLWPQTKRLD